MATSTRNTKPDPKAKNAQRQQSNNDQNTGDRSTEQQSYNERLAADTGGDANKAVGKDRLRDALGLTPAESGSGAGKDGFGNDPVEDSAQGAKSQQNASSAAQKASAKDANDIAQQLHDKTTAFLADVRGLPATDTAIRQEVNAQLTTEGPSSHGFTVVSPPDEYGRIEVKELPGFKILTNLAIQGGTDGLGYQLDEQQRVTIQSNTACDSQGNLGPCFGLYYGDTPSFTSFTHMMEKHQQFVGSSDTGWRFSGPWLDSPAKGGKVYTLGLRARSLTEAGNLIATNPPRVA